jgi:sRNA-binding carbon storage regulator CsrA
LVNAKVDSVTMPLVITRVPGEQLILTTPAGERIVIEAGPAPSKGDGAVRLVIDAPRSIQVLRRELEGRPRR